MNREQGISKAGPGKLRALMVQLAWGWLRFQPDSHLAKWYGERFGGTAKRSKRVGIVAVARKLVIALWRYVTQGVIPDGADVKSAGHRINTPRQRGFSARKLPRTAPMVAVAA